MSTRALALSTLVTAVALLAPALSAQQVPASSRARSASPGRAFSVVESGIPEMQRAMREGRVTSRELVVQSLLRIAVYNPRLNAVLAVNPHALDEAEALDRERSRGRVRGPLHGIPIALKDNINTTDMPTTGGAVAFEGLVPPYEATLVTQLREAGAVIIAKTVLTELANWVAGPPTPMPGNYSSLGGYGLNPYDPRRDPREATSDGRPALAVSGSSSPIGTAASFWAANVGTETSGSILSPSNQAMLVGIKPTVGRVSRYGVIPITADQDTPGPMARSVTDAAILLGVLEGAHPDPHDQATTRCTRPPNGDYTAFLQRGALKGARIGIPRAFYYDKLQLPDDKEPRGGLNPDQARVMADAIDVLRREGAIVIDPVEIPSISSLDPDGNLLKWPTCSGPNGAKGKDDHCSVVFKYGMKRDFNAWLASLGPKAPVKTLTELRAWNQAHAARGAIKYGQSLLDISDEMDVEQDRARYETDRARDVALGGERGLDAALQAHHLDALLFPGSGGAVISARPGYPTVIVPFATVPNAPTPPFPEGFGARPAPFGVSFAGTACSESRLVAIAYAFEQATRGRVAPALD
jgi:amidase